MNKTQTHVPTESDCFVFFKKQELVAVMMERSVVERGEREKGEDGLISNFISFLK